MSTGRESVAEEAEARAREQAERLQRQAETQGEQVKSNVASGLNTAAQSVRERSVEMGQPGLGARVAEPMERSAMYLQSHSVSQIGEDTRRTVVEHPLWTAVGLFATGYLVGRLVRRR
jgi:ElaB/YqjD/DUF883 family membrane-anchored ribosome-binding protein